MAILIINGFSIKIKMSSNIPSKQRYILRTLSDIDFFAFMLYIITHSITYHPDNYYEFIQKNRRVQILYSL